jgi:DNA-binding transcriptional regulator GbsR (MarR family)
MKTEEKDNAIFLRKICGLSLNEIANILKVSKGSVSSWVKDISLSKDIQLNLQYRNPASKDFKGKRNSDSIKLKALKKKKNFSRRRI